MIFNLYSRLALKLGEGERHVFDRSRLMFTEVQEIQKVTGMSYGEWGQALGRYDITAVAALLHVLRKRDGQSSDFGSMQFNAAELDVLPIHDDGTEYTPDEVAADLVKRMEEATGGNGAGPTRAGGALAMAPETSLPSSKPSISPSSPSGSEFAPGSGSTSRGRTSSSSEPASTP